MATAVITRILDPAQAVLEDLEEVALAVVSVDLVAVDLAAVAAVDRGKFMSMKFSEEFLVVRKSSALAR
jgi:hypothetical protein